MADGIPGFTPDVSATAAAPATIPGFTPDTSTAAPIQPAAPAQPSVAERAMGGVGQSLESNIVKPISAVAESAVTPPQDHKEAIAHIAAGTPGLQLYRLGKYLTDSIENTIETGKEGYQKGLQDFSRAVDEVGKGDIRNAMASAGGVVGDMMNMTQPGLGTGTAVKNIAEGTRLGADLAGPLAKTATDIATLAAGEKAPELIEGAKGAAGAAAKKLGVGGLEPAESLQKAAGGSAGISEKFFKENMDRALPKAYAENPKARQPEELSDAAHAAKTKTWAEFSNQVKDVVTQHAEDAWIDGKALAQDIKDGVDDFVRKHDASAAKAIDKWADTFAKAYPEGKYPLDKATSAVSQMNARVADTYKMDPGTRAAYIKRNPQLGMYEDAAESMRDKIDAKMEKWGHTDSAELRKDYGALAQMERVFEKRAITYGRQVPISLKQGLAYMAGVAGHPTAVAAALAEKFLNSPEHLIGSALDKMKPKTPPIAAPAASAATKVGVAAGQQPDSAETPEEWVTFKGSDGSTYEGHPSDWEAIQKADPGAQEIK